MAHDYLTVADVLGMHTVLMQRYGGAPGVRDPGALEAALFRPQTGYYDDIASAVGRGVYYYNIPMNTKRTLNLYDADTRAMFASGSIAGVKHTNLDLYEMERLRAINPELKCFGGFENEMVAFLAMGCDGFIGSTFNFMLPHYLKIFEAFNAGRLDEARELQVKANNIMEAIMGEGLFPSIKHILAAQGVDAGQMRRPFLPLSEQAAAHVDAVVADLRGRGLEVATGRFGALMHIDIQADGPFTVLVEA